MDFLLKFFMLSLLKIKFKVFQEFNESSARELAFECGNSLRNFRGIMDFKVEILSKIFRKWSENAQKSLKIKNFNEVSQFFVKFSSIFVHF